MTVSELIMKLEDLEKIGFGNASVYNQFAGDMGIGITKITTKDCNISSPVGTIEYKKSVFLE